MGLFNFKQSQSNRNSMLRCAQCEIELDRAASPYYNASGDQICKSCFKRNMDEVEQEQAKADENIANNFTEEVSYGIMGAKISIDKERKKIMFTGQSKKVFDYSDLEYYDYYENGGIETSGGLGRAAVGGLLFGGVGAIVGGNSGKKTQDLITSMYFKVKMRNSDVLFDIVIRSGSCKRNSQTYVKARETVNAITRILDNILDSTTSSECNSAQSNADEILKYKNLLDIGAITQEEFDAKKKQLLGL